MSDEPRMQVRDADLRKAIHAHGAAPGSDLWRLLRELQQRRDEEQGQGQPGRGAPGRRGRYTSPL